MDSSCCRKVSRQPGRRSRERVVIMYKFRTSSALRERVVGWLEVRALVVGDNWQWKHLILKEFLSEPSYTWDFATDLWGCLCISPESEREVPVQIPNRPSWSFLWYNIRCAELNWSGASPHLKKNHCNCSIIQTFGIQATYVFNVDEPLTNYIFSLFVTIVFTDYL